MHVSDFKETLQVCSIGVWPSLHESYISYDFMNSLGIKPMTLALLHHAIFHIISYSVQDNIYINESDASWYSIITETQNHFPELTVKVFGGDQSHQERNVSS